MPLIKSAIKKMRQDKAREKANRAKKAVVKKALKAVAAKPELLTLSEAFSKLDRAAKKGLIPRGRANRIKSRLSKVSSVETPKAAKKPPKKQKSVVVKSK